MTDDALITLDEAAALIPGATAASLRRHIRAGRLTAYKPGKAYLTTRADVRAMIEATAVKYAPQAPMQRFHREPPLPAGFTEIELANVALDQARENARSRRKAIENEEKAARRVEQELVAKRKKR